MKKLMMWVLVFVMVLTDVAPLGLMPMMWAQPPGSAVAEIQVDGADISPIVSTDAGDVHLSDEGGVTPDASVSSMPPDTDRKSVV